jgi:hypothetical protein
MQGAHEGAAAQQRRRFGSLLHELEQRLRDLVERRLLVVLRVASEVPRSGRSGRTAKPWSSGLRRNNPSNISCRRVSMANFVRSRAAIRSRSGDVTAATALVDSDPRVRLGV